MNTYQQITKYRFEDGSEFTDQQKALDYQILSQKFIDATAPLALVPKLNDAEFVQHDPHNVESVKRSVCALCDPFFFNQPYFAMNEGKIDESECKEVSRETSSV
jgi:hypothetical protein